MQQTDFLILIWLELEEAAMSSVAVSEMVELLQLRE